MAGNRKTHRIEARYRKSIKQIEMRFEDKQDGAGAEGNPNDEYTVLGILY